MHAIDSFKDKSIIQKLGTGCFILYSKVVDLIFDIYYGVDTRGTVELSKLSIIEHINLERSKRYQTTRLVPLRRLLSTIKNILPSDSVLIDFGCGKGKVLLGATEFGIKKIIGVEFAKELCDIALRNCETYRLRKNLSTNFQVICDDVLNYKFNHDENIFFMYNPFDDVILEKVINNISNSLKEKNRRIFIIYNTPVHANIIEKHKDLKKYFDFKLFHQNFIVYSNEMYP